MLTKSHYGLFGGILAGLAFAFWQSRNRQDTSSSSHHDHGEVIFSNTPRPAGL